MTELVFEALVVRRWPLVVVGSTGRFNRPLFRPAQVGQARSRGAVGPRCLVGWATSADLIPCNSGRGRWRQLAAIPTLRLINRGQTGAEWLRFPGDRNMRDALRRCGTGKRPSHLRLGRALGRLLACRCWRLSRLDLRCLLLNRVYGNRWMLGNLFFVPTYSCYCQKQ